MHTITLDMCPRRTNWKDFWMSDGALIGIDIYQNRESLDGHSYATVLAKLPKEFQRLLPIQVNQS